MRNSVILLLLFITIISSIIVLPSRAYANNGDNDSGFVRCGKDMDDPCSLCDLFDTANRIITFIRNIAFIVGGLLLVVGGIMFLLTGFSFRTQATAKRIVTSTVIGLIIIMLSFIIVSTILVNFAPEATYRFNLKSGAFEIECESPPPQAPPQLP